MPAFEHVKKLSKRTARRGALEPEDSDDQLEENIKEGMTENGDTTVQLNEPSQWVERMALVATKSLPDDLNPDDDPKREEVFVQHALLSVMRGIQLLEKAGVPWKRPDDYYAEMLKDDVHMKKIRESVEKTKRRIEEQAHRRAMKDQKKFGKEIQAETLRQRAKFKKDLADKVSDWRRKRGRDINETLDDVLNDGELTSPKRMRGKVHKRVRPRSLTPGGDRKRPGKNARRRR
jgi:rRNA-processing protein EBP2